MRTATRGCTKLHGTTSRTVDTWPGRPRYSTPRMTVSTSGRLEVFSVSRRPCGSLCLPSAPSPTLPGRHASIDRLGQRFWPHVGGDVWLTLDPVVRVDPHDRVLHRQQWRRRYWRPVGFTHGNGTPARSVDALTSDSGRRATNTRRAAATGPARAHVEATHLEPLDQEIDGLGWSGRQKRPRRGERKGIGVEGRSVRRAPWGRVDRLHRTVHDSSHSVVCPDPGSVLPAPAGVDLFSGWSWDGPMRSDRGQLEHAFVSCAKDVATPDLTPVTIEASPGDSSS